MCPHDCWDTCGLTVEVKDGRAVKVSGDPDHPITRGFLCPKVRHYEERVYSSDRVRYPLLRRGPKGSGSFRQVSWDEAIRTIAARWREIIRDFGPEAVLPYSYAGTMGKLNYGSLDRRFFNRMGASQLARTICSAAGGEALMLTYGQKLGVAPEAMVRARLIILWGINVLTTNIHQWPILEEARRRGAVLITIDPYRHETARRCDRHLRPRPGTDAALVLGMMNVIIEEGLTDRQYIEENTVGFECLADRAREFTPERAAAITGISKDEIVGLARLYAETSPALIRLGYGLQRHSNGGATVRAIACLPALTGAWREAGGGLLLSNSGAFPSRPGSLDRPGLISGAPRRINMIKLGQVLLDADPPVKSLYVYNSNPAVVAPQQNLVRRGLLREDLFTVVHEQMMTETAVYADVVLPATTCLEHWDIYTSYWHPYLQIGRPIIDPVGESKPNTEVFRLLARAMGYTESCLYETDRELMEQALDWDHPFLSGVTLERLEVEGRCRVAAPPAEAPVFGQGPFPTPSGKIELYSETLAAAGQDPLPAYHPLAESPDGSPDLFTRYPIQLLTPPARHFLNSTFSHLERFKKTESRPTIFIHPDDAARRGISSGDLVEVVNSRGRCRLWAEVGDEAPLGTAVSPSLWLNRDTPGGAGVNVLTSDREADYGGSSTFHTNLVQIVRLEETNEPA